MGFIAWKYNDRIINQNTAIMAAYSANESNYIDTIQGVAVIKSSNKENIFGSKIGTLFNQFQSSSIHLGKTGNQFNLIVEVLATLIILTIMAETAYFTLENILKIGEMMAILSIGIGIIPSCTRLMLTNLQIQEAKVAYNRMYEFTAIEPEDNNVLLVEETEWDQGFKKLEIKNLTFRFAGRRQLLKDINLIINSGEITALIGESGCGKVPFSSFFKSFIHRKVDTF
ncbi:hypothetical protein ASE92_00940 [Pedobacter sp. Leaf41]|nr:hypothetical protein ASE92_00940 [Pedobacter sp. Leaf41]